MRCIVHCAKDGERLGCVLSSRVPGRQDALHEHVLFEVMHCPYRFYPVFQPSLNLRCFGHESHVSRSFYGFMVRDKGHNLLLLRYEHGSATGKQSNTIIAAQYHAAQLFESLHRHTMPMQ
jgi:hypothetical protein